MKLVPLSLGLIALSSASFAQVTTVLLREGDPLVGSLANHTVTSIQSTNANTSGGFVVVIESSDGVTTSSHLWGAFEAASAGRILRTEGKVAGLAQTSFDEHAGISSHSRLIYSSTIGTGGTIDSLWRSEFPLAVTGDPAPQGKFWVSMSRLGSTGTSRPYWLGEVSDTPGGPVTRRGLYFNSFPLPLFVTGKFVMGLPEALALIDPVGPGFAFSHWGTRHILPVKMDGPNVNAATDTAMVFWGDGLMLAGSLVWEGSVIPASVGGTAGEKWEGFGKCGINEDGLYFFTGDSDGPNTSDDFLLQNGTIRFREGDVIDSFTVTGPVLEGRMIETGEIAYIWNVEDQPGQPLEALFFEDQLLIKVGDEIDWNGDGLTDPGFVVTDFTGDAALSMDQEGVIYFTAAVDTNGSGILEGAFAIEWTNPLQSYCFGDGSGSICPCGNLGAFGTGCANNSLSGARLIATGAPNAANDTLAFSAQQLPASVPGLFFQGTTALGTGNPFGDGFLCLTGSIRRLEIVMANASGEAISSVSISSAGSVISGDLRHYQLWYRDVTGPCNSGFNTTNAVAVQW